jgi:flagella basal body P-ring formation protein FlgA
MIRALLLAFALPLATAGAFANERRLVPHVAVVGDVVTLGDLVTNAGQAAATALFRAPDAGAFGTVQAWRIVEAARAYGVDGIDLAGVVEVRVERQTRVVAEVELVDAIASEMMKRLGVQDRSRVAVTIDGLFSSQSVDAAHDAALVLERLAHDPASGRFDAALVAVDAAGRRSRPLRVAGAAVEQVDVVRLRRTIGRGETVNAGDVAVERQSRLRLPADVIVAARDVIGFAARRSMTEGSVLRSGDVERPRVIARNDAVTIVFETANLVLTARGRALEGGAVGDVIEVQNTTSRRNVQGSVAGPGKVVVRLAPRRIAAAPAQTAAAAGN